MENLGIAWNSMPFWTQPQ